MHPSRICHGLIEQTGRFLTRAEHWLLSDGPDAAAPDSATFDAVPTRNDRELPVTPDAGPDERLRRDWLRQS